mmetsp:Transcript_7136/g.21874  ORF Transcript_7136/g.21874 Transcript_7136/m.21874 type:complete len:205 (+) Transcript_7136:477-1091(+)
MLLVMRIGGIGKATVTHIVVLAGFATMSNTTQWLLVAFITTNATVRRGELQLCELIEFCRSGFGRNAVERFVHIGIHHCLRLDRIHLHVVTARRGKAQRNNIEKGIDVRSPGTNTIRIVNLINQFCGVSRMRLTIRQVVADSLFTGTHFRVEHGSVGVQQNWDRNVSAKVLSSNVHGSGGKSKHTRDEEELIGQPKGSMKIVTL